MDVRSLRTPASACFMPAVLSVHLPCMRGQASTAACFPVCWHARHSKLWHAGLPVLKQHPLGRSWA